MKKLIALLAIVCVFGNVKSQCPTFSLNSSSGNFTLGCNPSALTINPVITSTVSTQIVSYYISGTGITGLTSTPFYGVVKLPGTYTVYSSSLPFSSCTSSQTFTVYPNPAAPTVTVSPNTATISCSGSAIFSANCTPTANVTGVWYLSDIYSSSNTELTLSPPGTAISFTAGAPGRYIALYKDNSNGCLNVGEVTVASSPTVGMPTLMSGDASPNAYLPCANNSVTVGIWSNSVLNPITYTFTNLTTSVSTFPANGSLVVTSPGYYKGEMYDGNFCMQFVNFYIGTNTISPAINVFGNNTVCKGTSTNLQAYGTTSYTWSTGATTSTVNILPTTTTNYTVTGMSGVCSGSAITTVSVDNTCSDVWPGDASSDGAANLFDVLEIGLQSGFTGPARSYTSNAWQTFFANNWTGTISNGKNRCHADCNGDGTVTATDVNAVTANWGLTHTFKLNNETVLNPDVNIIPDQPLVQIGTWGTASIYLGETTNNINLYGLAFDINHNNALIQTDSIYIEYIPSFLNTGGTNIEFQKEIFPNGAVYAASTRTDHLDVNGNGKIGILHFKAVSTLTTDAVLNLNLGNGTKSSAAGSFSSLTSGAGSLTITTAAISVNELSNVQNAILIYPNPTSNTLYISAKGNEFENSEIELINYLGQSVFKTKFKSEMDVSELSNGVYVLQIKNSQNQISVKRFVIAR